MTLPKNIFDLSTLKEEKLKSNGDPCPELDCGTCSECGWSGSLSDCETDQEGNYYDGYITAVYCPVCEDGGCIDDFYPSDESLAEWEKDHARVASGKENGEFDE